MDELADLLHDVGRMGVDELRARWRLRFGEPPPVRSGDVLRRALAERLQEAAFGADTELRRRLQPMAARVRVGRKPVISAAQYKAGAILVKDWDGARHRVEVVEDGFIWNGERHRSLSAIARRITGVRWNGPRFFGLREGA
jgi:hypothetical protein